MNQASHWTRYFVATASAAAALFNPIDGWAADPAVLPWDYALDSIQNFVAGPLAHIVIVIAAICAVLGFALAGDNELVRRFAKAVVGTGAALLAVQLLNYLAP
jgi:type IV secretory pathway VirB2 component (pilin)